MNKTTLDKKINEIEFSGAIRILKDNNLVYEKSFGYADRSNRLANSINTRFGIASGTKTFTAIGIGRLIDEGKIQLDTPIHQCLSESFPKVDKRVTIDHLLTHSSGIYDYFDEGLIEDFDNFELSVPNHKLFGPEDYIPMLHGDMKFQPGEKFCYCNSGYILLALVIEELSGTDYSSFIENEVFKRAGMDSSGYFRMDQLPERTAYGYLDDKNGWRTNFFSVPIKGGGDGGAFTTLSDLEIFWKAFLEGRIISSALVKRFTESCISAGNDDKSSFYGRGLWIKENEAGRKLIMEGCDAGVSCLSFCDSPSTMYTVLSNTTSGAYVLNKIIKEIL